jgi:ribose 5-phosphate isomerase A
MPSTNPTRQAQQRSAAERAVQFVESGMVLGLGSGTTANLALRGLADRLREGTLRDIRGVPSSDATAMLARELDLPLTTLDEHPRLDLTLDGADEVDPQLDLIKGGGAALLREKMLAQASERVVIIVDESKLSRTLGLRRLLPVEVVAFGWGAQQRYLQGLGAEVGLRRGEEGRPVLTDNGNLILDCKFARMDDPTELAAHLDARAGVVEHGLFIGLTTDLICAGADGVRHEQPGEKAGAEPWS